MPPQTATRPRTVTPQSEPTAPTSSLDDILARAGVVPFNPNSGGSTDIGSLLSSILQPPTSVPQPQPSLLNTILTALGNGIATATSGNPGAVLQSQLNARQQQTQDELNYQRQQSDRQNQLRQQLGLSLVQSKLGEDQQIREEVRKNAYRKEERDAQEQANIRQYNMEFAGKQQLENINFENQKRLAKLQLDWQSEKQNKIDARYEEERKQDQTLKKLDVKLGLVRSGIPAGVATSIADKWFADQPLTKGEEQTLTATAQRALRVAQGGGRSSGGSSASSDKVTLKNIDNLLIDAVKTPYVQMQDGTVMEVTAVPKDDFGQRLGVAKYLTPQESAQYAATHQIPAILSARQLLLRGKSPQEQKVQTQPYNVNDNAFVQLADQKQPGVIQKAGQYEAAFYNFIKQGATAQLAAKMLLDAVGKEIPEQDRIIVTGVVGNQLKQLKPTAKAQQPGQYKYQSK